MGLLFLGLLSGCGLNSEGRSYLELIASYPANGESQVRTFGRYYLVFNEKIAYSAADAVTASFSASPRIYSSNETLYVERKEDFPAYNTRDSILVGSLSLASGRSETVAIRIAFTTAGGENEDNNTAEFADTLRPGSVLDGRMGNGGNPPIDNDWFMVVPDSGVLFRVNVSLLDATPLYCIVSRPDTLVRISADSSRFDTIVNPYTVIDLKETPSADFTGTDTLRFRLTNHFLQLYPPEGAYRLNVTGL